jgi:hypothetical protein
MPGLKPNLSRRVYRGLKRLLKKSAISPELPLSG